MDCSITPLSPHTGAEVRGIDLRGAVDGATRTALNRAFVAHSVLVIRDQQLSPEQMLAGAQLFGEVFQQHNSRFALQACPLVHYISNQDTYADGTRYIPGEGYHTDHSNDATPPKATVLHAVTLPSDGGDTQYVNMHLAYETLPETMQRRLDGLQAIHVYQSRFSGRKLMGLAPEAKDRVPQAVMHPIVRTHPETGRKALYINPIRVEGIVGMAERPALDLLDELLEHAVQPQHQYRNKWQPGDLVLWDNRALLHKANGDYDMSELRYLYRLMLRGDKPV